MTLPRPIQPYHFQAILRRWDGTFKSDPRKYYLLYSVLYTYIITSFDLVLQSVSLTLIW